MKAAPQVPLAGIGGVQRALLNVRMSFALPPNEPARAQENRSGTASNFVAPEAQNYPYRA